MSLENFDKASHLVKDRLGRHGYDRISDTVERHGSAEIVFLRRDAELDRYIILSFTPVLGFPGRYRFEAWAGAEAGLSFTRRLVTSDVLALPDPDGERLADIVEESVMPRVNALNRSHLDGRYISERSGPSEA